MHENSGLFGTIDVETRTPHPELGPASNDAVARYWQGKIFVLNRFSHDNIQVMDIGQGFRLLKQYSVGTRSNPQDMVIVSEKKAYISRLAKEELLLVQPLSGKKRGTIDLSHLAETGDKTCKQDKDCSAPNRCLQGHCTRDGIPELAQMYLQGKRLFVLAQRLDRNTIFTPKNKGKLAVIDTDTDQLLTTIDLQGSNPTQILPAPDGKTLWVVQTGRWGNDRNDKAVLDGLIEAIDPVQLKSLGGVITEKDLGGNLGSVVAVSGQLAYTILTGDPPLSKTTLVQFNPSAPGKGKEVAQPNCEGSLCYFFWQIALNKRGEIYLLDRHPKKPGVRVFQASSGKEITQAPLDMKKPPAFLLFYP